MVAEYIQRALKTMKPPEKDVSHLNLLGKEKWIHLKSLLKVRRRHLKQWEIFVLHYYLCHFQTAVGVYLFLFLPNMKVHNWNGLFGVFLWPDLELLECSFKVPVQSPLPSIQTQLWCGRGCNEHRESAQPRTASAAAHSTSSFALWPWVQRHDLSMGSTFITNTLMSLLEIKTTLPESLSFTQEWGDGCVHREPRERVSRYNFVPHSLGCIFCGA